MGTGQSQKLTYFTQKCANCCMAIEGMNGAPLSLARRFAAAAATALPPIAGALLIALLSTVEAGAQGSVGACDDAELAVLSSPIAPWKGAPLRVVFAAEK